jgi:DNA-binding transcriptional regulator YdaS (Cro superfamily)
MEPRSKYPALREYLNSLEPSEQEDFAGRCETTVGYLRKVLSTGERVREGLAISLSRESAGKVPVEEMRPDVDWEYLRGRTSSPRRSTTRKFGT